MAEPLQLLEVNSRITANAFDQINRSMTAKAERDQQQSQFEASLVQRGLEFGAEMAFKDRAQTAENMFNVARIQSMQFGNELDWKRFQAEQELQPLKRDIEVLKLQGQKEQTKRILQQGREFEFSKTTEPHDIRAAGILASNKNADFGNAYLSLRGKYLGQVAGGQPFNEPAYSSELDLLVNQYGSTPVTDKAYDPQVAVLMDKMGANVEANRYRAENPVFSGSITGIKADMLLGDNDQFTAGLKTAGFLIKDEEAAQLAVVRNSLNGYRTRIAGKQQELRSLIQASSYEKDPTEKQKNDVEIARVNSEIISLNKAHDNLFNKTVGFEIQDLEPPTEESIEAKKAEDRLGRAKEEAKAGSDVAPDPKSQSWLTQSKEANDAEANIGAYTSQFPEALGDKVSFRNWQGQNPRSHPAFAKSLRNEIIQNVDSVPLDASEAESDDGPTIEKLISSESFKKVFEELKENAVELPPLFSDGGPNIYIGDRNFWQWAGSSGLDMSSFAEIDTHEEFVNYARQLKKEIKDPNKARDMIQALYASVVAAGAINRFSQGK